MDARVTSAHTLPPSAVYRTLLDCALSLPLTLVKNRLQAGQVLCGRGCAVFALTYTLSTGVGYCLLSSASPGASGMILAGGVSAVGELAARPLLTRQNPTRLAAGFMLAREVVYFSGLRVTNGLTRESRGYEAIANQLFVVCGLCNVLDVLLARSITNQWKSPRQALYWASKEQGLVYMLGRSGALRVLSGCCIPILVMNMFPDH